MRIVRSLAVILVLAFASLLAAAELPGQWQKRAAMPSARTEVAAAEVNGKIFIIGGYEKGGELVEEYDADLEALDADVRDTLSDLERRKLIEFK